MAIIVDRQSEYEGERVVRQAIADCLSDDVVVYNNREINGREYDLCLLLKGIGIMLIEVKGWTRDIVTVHGIDDIEIKGYGERQTSPKKQAKSYRIQYVQKLKKKYTISPLVMDMVAYPFITREEYNNLRLDIISEEQFTIFKEDLNGKNALVKKLNMAYDALKTIPHAEFTEELMLQIRQDGEVNLGGTVIKGGIPPYSVLFIYPGFVQKDQIQKILKEYASGVKQVIFTGDREAFQEIMHSLDLFFQSENIEPDGNKLRVGYENGIGDRTSLDSYHTFNFEVYYIPELCGKCEKNIRIEEGNIAKNDEEMVSWLGKNSTFNLEQYKVEHADPEKNTLVEAGAGTGKTFTMVSRVAFLCNRRQSDLADLAEDIALVTFTNEAANNMKGRLKQMFLNYFILTGNERFLTYVENVDRANISTIHKFAFNLLREASIYTGLGINFRISSDLDTRSKIYDGYLNDFLNKKAEENANFTNEIPVPVYEIKKKLIGVADCLLNKGVDLEKIKPSEMGVPVKNALPYFNELIEQVILPAEQDYLDYMKQENKVNLKECIILLNKVLSVPGFYPVGLNLKYLFVDEFQDTDDVQIEIFQKLQRLIQKECRLFVVGDLKQSIYRFRGAKLSAFEQVQGSRLYNWLLCHLNINYRTDYRLLELCDVMFERWGSKGYLPYKGDQDRLRGVRRTSLAAHELLQCIPCHGKKAEVFFDTLFDEILAQQKEKLCALMKEERLSQEERTIAILVRNNWQIEKIVKEAEKRKIVVEVETGGDLFQFDSTQDLYKLVFALENGENPVALVNLIESNFMELKIEYQKYYGHTIFEKISSLSGILDQLFLARMEKTWGQVIEDAYTQPILYVLKQIYDALEPWKQYSDRRDEQRNYMANFDYLLEKITKFSRMDTLTLSQIEKYLAVNIMSEQKELGRAVETKEDEIHIFCTTVHKSKGLEYGTVILPYTYDEIGNIQKGKLEAAYAKKRLSYRIQFENNIQEQNSNYDEKIESDEQIAEEARILYVALTRAIRNCIWIQNLDQNTSISWATLLGE